MEISKDKIKIYGGGGGTVTLMLGLYLIILSFFILLNSISDSSDANYEKASNSLKNSFGFSSGEIEPTEDEINITVEEFYSGIAKKLTGIVSSYFPANNYDLSHEVGKIIITVPTKKLFDRNSVSVNPMIYSFFFDMVRMLNNLVDGLEISLEINIQVQGEKNMFAVNNRKLEKAALRSSDIFEIISGESDKFKELKSSVNLSKKDVVNFYIIFNISDYQKALLSYRDYIQ